MQAILWWEDFENVLNNYGSIIRKVNEKFNRNF
jgi:hypothetical protein